MSQVPRRQLRLPERELNRPRQAEAVGTIGHVTTVTTGTHSQDFAIDRCAATDRVFVPLDHEGRRSLTGHRSVPVQIERTAGVSRVVPLGQALVQVEPGDFERMNVRTAGSHDHHVGGIAFDGADASGQSQQGGGFATGDRVVWTARIVLDGNVARGHVRQLLEQPQRCDLSQTVFGPLRKRLAFRHLLQVLRGVGQFLGRGRNVTGPKFDAQSLRIDRSARQPRILHGHRRTGDTQLDVAGHDLEELFLIDVFEGVEVTDFGRQFGGEIARGKCRERVDSRTTGDQVLPERIPTDANR